MKRLQPHPIALLFPAMSHEEYQFLKEDIQQHGLKHPLVLLGGKIVDGWHRYRICLELRLKPRFVELPRGADALAESVSANLARRQLSPAQRYGTFLRIADQFPEMGARIEAVRTQARQRQAKGRPLPHLRQRSSGAIGELCGVSHATVERVDRLRRLSEEAFDAVMEGSVPLLHALNRAWATARRRKQESLGPAPGVEPQVRVVCGDFRKVLKTQTIPSISLCLADPPWDRGSLPLWEAVGLWASKVLRSGGVLLAYPSKVELPEVLRILGQSIRFHWMAAAFHAEPLPLPKLRVLSKWQPITLHVKGTFAPPLHPLDVAPGGKEKDQHVWQRPVEEFAYYIRHLTRPGEWILDLMAGSFASGRAAQALGRNYLGVDIDPKAVAKGRKWLEEE